MSNFLNVLKSFSESIKNGLLLMLIYGIALAYSNTNSSAGDKFLFKFLIGNKKLTEGKEMRAVAMEVFEESLIGIKLLFIIVGIVTSFINKDIYYGNQMMTLKDISFRQTGISFLVAFIVTGIAIAISKFGFKTIPNKFIIISIYISIVLMYNTALFSGGNSANRTFIWESVLYAFFGGLSIGIMASFRSSTPESTIKEMMWNGSSGFFMGGIFYYILNIIFQFSGLYTIGELSEKDIFKTSKSNVNVKERFEEAFRTTTRRATATTKAPPQTSHKKKGIEALLGLKDGLFYSMIAIIGIVIVYFSIITTLIREWPTYVPLYKEKPWLFIIETLAFVLTNAVPTVFAMQLRKSSIDKNSLFIITFLQFVLIQIVLQGSGFYNYIFRPVAEGELMNSDD
jgi:hypothetical protein